MSTASSQVTKLYRTVVEDVINNVKEAFLDEGIDEQVLQELKQLWEGKLASSKALEAPPEQEAAIAPQNVTMLLPQSLQTSTQQDQGAMAQPTQIQATTQYQLTPAAAGATLALPTGLFQQQIAAIGAGGQIQNITVQQTGTGQYITLAGLPQLQQQQQQAGQQPQLAQHLTPQILQQQQQHQLRLSQQPQAIRLQQQPQHIRIQQQPQQLQQQQPKLLTTEQLLQQNQTTIPSQVNRSQGGIHQSLIQLDGNGDTSSSDDDDLDDDDDNDEEERGEENEEEEQGEEEDPLNTDDDVSEDDPTELFDTENVVVCQYDKINRNKNKWKFHLKDGIMNLNGRDFVFQKATGDAEW